MNSGVKALCTTDDPADDLRWHQALANDAAFPVQVLPTFRPDKAIHLQNPVPGKGGTAGGRGGRA